MPAARAAERAGAAPTTAFWGAGLLCCHRVALHDELFSQIRQIRRGVLVLSTDVLRVLGFGPDSTGRAVDFARATQSTRLLTYTRTGTGLVPPSIDHQASASIKPVLRTFAHFPAAHPRASAARLRFPSCAIADTHATSSLAAYERKQAPGRGGASRFLQRKSKYEIHRGGLLQTGVS